MLAEGLKEALRRRTFRPKKFAVTSWEALKRGVNGTPTFFINGTRDDAGDEYEELVVAIDSQLAIETSGQAPHFAPGIAARGRRKGEEIAMVIQSSKSSEK